MPVDPALAGLTQPLANLQSAIDGPNAPGRSVATPESVPGNPGKRKESGHRRPANITAVPAPYLLCAIAGPGCSIEPSLTTFDGDG